MLIGRGKKVEREDAAPICRNHSCMVFTEQKAIQQTLQDERGAAEAVIYPVFSGIELVYHSVHRDQCSLGSGARGKVVEIHHCREGRLEQQYGDTFFYLMPGDLSISIRETPVSDYEFPLWHYHGISIVIDLEKAPGCLSCFLEDVNVQPMAVARKLCGDGNCFVLRRDAAIEHIFSELYSVPESYRKGYFKIKILELLLVLSGKNPGKDARTVPGISGEQVAVAKRAAAFLGEHMNQRITVAELAARFHVSQTHLQNAFKGVYGVPVYSYIRIWRMQAAALQLIRTDRSVMDIASTCSYDNASKFSAAFRDIMGETPAEYRRMHGKQKK